MQDAYYIRFSHLNHDGKPSATSEAVDKEHEPSAVDCSA